MLLIFLESLCEKTKFHVYNANKVQFSWETREYISNLFVLAVNNYIW
jgi:hypothetical protein